MGYSKAGIDSIVEGIKLYNKDELIEKFGWEEYFIFALMLKGLPCHWDLLCM